MSKNAVYIITFVVCILLQVAIAPAISIMGASPLFILIPVVLVSLHSGMVSGSISGFLCGLLYDFIYSNVLGCMALCFVLIALIIGFIGKNISTHSIAISALIAVVCALFTEIIYGIAVVLTNTDATGIISTVVTYSLPSALYSAIFLFVALVTIHLVMEGDASVSLGGTSNSRAAKLANQGRQTSGLQFASRATRSSRNTKR